MKFLLLSVVCLIGAVVAKPAQTKQKRDILPGDPRYGTDYHHNHHHAHHHHENEVEVSRSLGGYIGSYTVPENSGYENNVNFQLPKTSYGPPDHTPGKPIHVDHPQPEVTVPVKQTVNQYQRQQIPSYTHQEVSISNFKPSENVETISNGYLSPVVDVTQAPITQYTSSAVNYEPVVHQQEQHLVATLNNDYLPPVTHTAQKKTVPVTSYGTPVPEYEVPEVQPAVEKVQEDETIEVKSQATASSDTSSDTYKLPATPVEHDVKTAKVTPVNTVSHAHADANTHVHVQPEVKAVQTVQEQVSHVHRAVQPAVQHHFKQTVQPAVQHQVTYQSVQTPQSYPIDYIGNTGGSFNNFNTFDTVNSGFPTSYGTPNFQVSSGVAPQYYNSDISNLGFGYEQDFNSNLNQHAYTTSHVHQPVQSYDHHFRVQVPQTYQYELTRNVQYPIPQVIQSPIQVPSFVQTEIPQFPPYQGSTQVFQQPAQSNVVSQSESVNVDSVSHKHVQPATVQVNSNSYTGVKSYNEPTQPIGSNGGYVY